MTPKAFLKKIKEALEDKKGIDIQILDLKGIASYTDYLVLCTGTSGTHVSALVANVKDVLEKIEKPVHINYSKDNSWWVLDYSNVVIHVFKEDVRRFYDLEQLWGDASRLTPKLP